MINPIVKVHPKVKETVDKLSEEYRKSTVVREETIASLRKQIRLLQRELRRNNKKAYSEIQIIRMDMKASRAQTDSLKQRLNTRQQQIVSDNPDLFDEISETKERVKQLKQRVSHDKHVLEFLS